MWVCIIQSFYHLGIKCRTDTEFWCRLNCMLWSPEVWIFVSFWRSYITAIIYNDIFKCSMNACRTLIWNVSTVTMWQNCEFKSCHLFIRNTSDRLLFSNSHVTMHFNTLNTYYNKILVFIMTTVLIVMSSHKIHARWPVTTSRSMYTFPCSPSSSVWRLRAGK